MFLVVVIVIILVHVQIIVFTVTNYYTVYISFDAVLTRVREGILKKDLKDRYVNISIQLLKLV